MSKKTKQDIENTDEEDLFKGMSTEGRTLFERALEEAIAEEVKKIENETKNIEIPPPSKRRKIGMNRVFRERVGGDFLPFPEVDNFYERARSKIVIKLKVNEFFDRSKKRKREKKVRRKSFV